MNYEFTSIRCNTDCRALWTFVDILQPTIIGIASANRISTFSCKVPSLNQHIVMFNISLMNQCSTFKKSNDIPLKSYKPHPIKKRPRILNESIKN